jgi:hypothetical protein
MPVRPNSLTMEVIAQDVAADAVRRRDWEAYRFTEYAHALIKKGKIEDAKECVERAKHTIQRNIREQS